MRKLVLLTILGCLISISGFADRFIPDSDLTKRVLDIVNELYVDSSRVIPETMLEGALDNLSASIAPVLTQIESDGNYADVEIRVDQFNRGFRFRKPRTTSELNNRLQMIMRFVKLHLDADEKPETVDYAIINGFLSQLDPHSSLLIPEIYSDFSTNSSGNFGGVGMMIGLRDGHLTIIAPIDNTPASRTGLKAKDRIVQINEESTVNMSLTDAVKKLRGEKGTKVEIYIMRKGFTSPKKFTIVRDIIEITSVESFEFREKKSRVGYIKINTFQQNTMDEVNSHLVDLDYDLNDFMGLVIDLRNNPGGLLDQAIKVSDRFLSDGVIVSTAGLNPKSIHSFDANWLRSIEDIPIIVLVNNGSASASEIVTAALKKNNRAVVLGIQTFGKGSVQQVIPFKDGSALRLTTSKYLTPGNISIQSVGVTPHITVSPYFISNDFLMVTPPTLDNAEKDLDQNFSEWGDKAEDSIKTVFYLYDDSEESSEEEDEDEDPEQLRQKRVQNDFLIRSAVDILRENNKKDFEHLLTTALQYSDVLEQTQKQVVIDRFAEFSTPIDWNIYPFTKKGKIESAVWLETKAIVDGEEKWERHEGAIDADSEIRLYVKASNVGDARISRLLAMTECENRIFDDRQLVFGKLEPGESQHWYIPINIAEASDSRNSLIHFQFTDQELRKIHTDSFALFVKAKKRPLIAYRLTPFDNGQHGSKGNGDSFLQENETIAIKLDITNQGEGMSGPLTLIFRNGEGKRVYLKQGRQTTTALKTGETKSSIFRFELKKAPRDRDLDFSLDIVDATFPRSSLKHKLKIPIASNGNAITNTPPMILVTNEEVLTVNNEYKLKGSILDPQGVKDMYIFKNQKKIFYKNFLVEEDQMEVEYSLDIQLVEENNRIVIVARDQENVSTQKDLYLRYNSAM